MAGDDAHALLDPLDDVVRRAGLQEGDTAAPGVVLETIRQKEVVLRAQGYRFTEKY